MVLWSVVDTSPDWVKPKTIRLVFVASPLSTQHYGKRAKTGDLIDFLVFNATFSNISAISRRPVLVVEETGVPEENHRPWASNW